MSESRQRRQREKGAGRFSLLALFAWLAFAAADRALAQLPGPPPPAVLTAATVAVQPGGLTRLTLVFQPLAPKYSIIDNDSGSPSIAFALSSRALTLPAPPANGLLRSVAFDQEDTVLVLHFSAAARTRVTAAPVGSTIIVITFAPAPEAPAPRLAAAPADLPKMVDRPAGQDGFEIVPLKYADVSEVAGLLTQGLTINNNDAFTPQEPAFGASSSVSAGAGPTPAQAGAAAESIGQSLGDAVAIDRRLNAIILKGSPQRIAALKALIARIDLPLRGVLFEMAFVELDESAANSLGLDFNNTSSELSVATFRSGGYLPAGARSGPALTSVSLQSAIAAQVQSGHGRIINKPRIAAQSGSTAKLITGDALPILTSVTLAGVSGVSQQVEYVNVGVTLQIAPRVSADGYVTSKVFCVVSSVTGTSRGYPTISQQEAQTSATVRDGDTFVIGGLSQESDTATYTTPTGAGQPPLLGGALNQAATTRSRSELYIVVTPHIVKPWEPGTSMDVASH